MAGIAGWTAPARNAPEDSAIAPMLEALAHRGAGGAGVCAFANNDSGGHRAVLGERGAEPLCDAAAGIAVVLDGDILNRKDLRAELGQRGYRFAGDSSAEVLLRAYQRWDTALVHQLRGPFAFAIWDAGKERLFIARDRLGERPLYLHERAGRLYFASEMKALLKAPGVDAKVDLQAVWDVLAFNYALAPKTLLTGIRKLLPATYALWQFGRLREARYWTLPDRFPRAQTRAPADAIDQFIACLDEVVKLHLSGSGAPGLFLSGGVDSGVLLALMSRHGEVRTFSAGIEGDRASELAQAARVARHFGATHQELVLTPRDLTSGLTGLVAQCDAPLCEPADLVLHALARASAGSVRRVVTGEGSDELLGGYRRHLAARLGWGVQQLPTALRRTRAERSRLSVLKLNGADIIAGMPPFDAAPQASRLRRSLYFDQASALPDQLLERADRIAMAQSLDLRAPFVDHRLAEQVSALPDELRVRGLSTKWILRRAARRLVPRALIGRSARLRAPAGAWLRGEMRDLLLDHLRGSGSLTRAYYSAAALDRMLDEHLNGKLDHEKPLWTLLNLEIFHRTWRRG
jgi:asparagine synthase (glutamine-hydrolysing)